MRSLLRNSDKRTCHSRAWAEERASKSCKAVSRAEYKTTQAYYKQRIATRRDGCYKEAP